MPGSQSSVTYGSNGPPPPPDWFTQGSFASRGAVPSTMPRGAVPSTMGGSIPPPPPMGSMGASFPPPPGSVGGGQYGTMSSSMMPRSGDGNEVFLQSMFGPVSMGKQSKPWGSTAGMVVPTEQSNVQKQKADLGPLPDELPKVPNSEIRRQQIAMQVWQKQEQDLTRRVTMIENLIRRTVDMPAYDVRAINRDQNSRDRQEPFKGDVPFNEVYVGPLPGGEDCQVKDAQANTYYVEPKKAMLQAEKKQLEADAKLQWRNEHPITMTMAGDMEYVKRFLYLDKPPDEDELYWQSMNADYYQWRSRP